MAHVCPWWFVFTFDNPVRSLLHKPERLFAPYVAPGANVLDVGCGAGFSTKALARLVGPTGRVTAVDLQPNMLAMTEGRLRRAGLLERVRRVCASADSLNLGDDEKYSFAIAFWMVHEVPDASRFLRDVRRLLLPEAALFVAEPRGHVSSSAFEEMVAEAKAAGFEERSRPKVAFSRAVVLAVAPTRTTSVP